MRLPYQNGACRVSSPYGERTLNGVPGWHNGIDLVGLDGDRVLVAPCDGVIRSSTLIPKNDTDDTWEWGNYIRLDTADGYNIFMCHMAERRVKAGQTVKAGDIVGIQGNSGYSFGEHCHFEVRRNGATINPANFLGIKNAVGVYRTASETHPPDSGLAVGQEVWYVGTKQYASSFSEKAVEAKPCRAKVTAVYPKGRHPYHIVGNDVYGWVNKSDALSEKPTLVRVVVPALNIRSGAGMNYSIVGVISDKGLYALSSVSGKWGKLKNGKGWISLAYAKAVELS